MFTKHDLFHDFLDKAKDYEFIFVLVETLSTKASQMNAKELANSIHGLGRLLHTFAWDAFVRSNHMQFSRLPQGSDFEVTPMMQQSLLTSDLLKCIDRTEQELGNTMWGLGQIGNESNAAVSTTT